MTTATKPSAEPRAGPDTPEEALVAAARARDDAAIRELIRRLNPRLFRVARGILPSDAEAEEVVQDAYLAAFTRLDEFRGRARFSTWVTRIAINTALMRVRRARPQEGYDTVNEEDSSRIISFPGQQADSPEASLGRSQMRGVLEAAVADLPSDLRLPFLLYEVEGMAIRDIAHDLSLNPITVKTRLFRARRRLRATLEQQVHGGFGTIFPFDGMRCVAMADRVVAMLKAQRHN
ncbi:RNA polymerase sigma factor [Microbaculum marinisediminis]|uniref:RNA polymerase sigma factor n=1 Tax=Microbaculum marinisediminis TaxID=2931392 RepID=A0AAW5R3D1_9HYPH|nr:RNA polymerase sigma factor [Microbaculum sp. A6E488]MCT8973900.1 RNA polymerase sigma factor [Microbaculum sp. A6E488]